jgi:hypothetical protein
MVSVAGVLLSRLLIDGKLLSVQIQRDPQLRGAFQIVYLGEFNCFHSTISDDARACMYFIDKRTSSVLAPTVSPVVWNVIPSSVVSVVSDGFDNSP